MKENETTLSGRLILQAVDDGQCMHIKMRASDVECYFAMGAVIENIHYEHLLQGRSAEDSMRIMHGILEKVEKRAFKLGQKKYNEKQKESGGSNCD